MKGESLKTWCFRQAMNKYPMFFGTGGKIIFLKKDFKHVIVRLKLNLWTYNYVGTIFGGSQFAALDPFHMVLLINCLGKDYVILDKAGSIKFKKPGKGTIQAEIIYTDEELQSIREETNKTGRYEFTKSVDWKNQEGEVISTLEKTVYVATKEYFKNRKK